MYFRIINLAMIMVRNFFFTTSFLFLGFALNAQTCTPDFALKKSGFLPAVLPAASANTFYNQGVSVLTFRDTYRMVGIIKVPIQVDSIKVTGIAGLPSGFSYRCQHPRCVYLWDTVRCISIYGTATKTGTYPLKIYLKAFAKLAGSTAITQNDSISSYTLDVVDNTSGKVEITGKGFSLFPNPADNKLTIVDQNPTENWYITDLSGRKINAKPYVSGNQHICFETVALAQGVYIATDGNRSARFVIQR